MAHGVEMELATAVKIALIVLRTAPFLVVMGAATTVKLVVLVKVIVELVLLENSVAMGFAASLNPAILVL